MSQRLYTDEQIRNFYTACPACDLMMKGWNGSGCCETCGMYSSVHICSSPAYEVYALDWGNHPPIFLKTFNDHAVEERE